MVYPRGLSTRVQVHTLDYTDPGTSNSQRAIKQELLTTVVVMIVGLSLWIMTLLSNSLAEQRRIYQKGNAANVLETFIM